MFLNGGLNKIFNYIPVPTDLSPALVADNAAFLEISWLMPLVAIGEIIGGLLLKLCSALSHVALIKVGLLIMKFELMLE